MSRDAFLARMAMVSLSLRDLKALRFPAVVYVISEVFLSQTDSYSPVSCMHTYQAF